MGNNYTQREETVKLVMLQQWFHWRHVFLNSNKFCRGTEEKDMNYHALPSLPYTACHFSLRTCLIEQASPNGTNKYCLNQMVLRKII